MYADMSAKFSQAFGEQQKMQHIIAQSLVAT
jgi:hypothetical protein